MSVSYRTVQWNRHKIVYDAILAGVVSIYLGLFIAIGATIWPISPEILLIRAFGTGAIVLLHVILGIGPLARLTALFSPLLYNRRHLGVTMFALAAAHGGLSIVWYHGFGNINPLASLLTSSTRYNSFSGFPFEILGVVALFIFLLMAATSHDFWLKNLSPGVWKWLHMMIYPAYALVVMHVALGILQTQQNPIFAILLAAGMLTLILLHLAAGLRETARQARNLAEWIDVCGVKDIPDSGAKVVCVKDRERIAIFRHGRTLSAVSNVCAHQQGPLGDGKIIDGCITCPWHGYQYLPHNGQSPPPFTEKIPTFALKVENGRVILNPEALAPGTPVAPASIDEVIHAR